MIKSNTERKEEHRSVDGLQVTMKYPMQYELTFVESQLRILQHPYIEVCPSCGALSMESEYRRKAKMKMKEPLFISFQNNQSQLSLNLGI